MIRNIIKLDIFVERDLNSLAREVNGPVLGFVFQSRRRDGVFGATLRTYTSVRATDQEKGYDAKRDQFYCLISHSSTYLRRRK